jgi:voltage-gated potassium channel
MKTRWLQNRLWEIVEISRPGDRLSRAFNVSILSLIFLNVAAVIIESIDGIRLKYGIFFRIFEVFSIIVFTIEYIARMWSCVVDARYERPVIGRLSFARQPMSIIDLLVVLPFYIPLFGIDLRFMRAVRLLRVLRIAKIGRYSTSLKLIGNVMKSKKDELAMTVAVMALLLVISACIMYECENQAQPKAFPDIPTTMWWSVVTLTTVGYGDVYPITALGRFFAAITAILGIGMFALPTGIIGAGFVEEINKRKSKPTVCPHCGKEI